MTNKLAESLALSGIDESTRALLRETWPLIREGVPYALKSAFALAAGQEAVPGRATHEQITAARNSQAQHWEALFAAKFDEPYAESVRQIAVIHAKVGLDPRWLVSGHLTTLTELHSLVLATHCASMMTWGSRSRLERVIRAVDQAVMFDLQLCVAAYAEQAEATAREAIGQMARAGHGAAAATLADAMLPAGAESRRAASEMFVASQRRTFLEAEPPADPPAAFRADPGTTAMRRTFSAAHAALA